MEYTTAFFDAVKNRRASEGPTDLISRKRYNSKDYRHQLMRDIAEVEIGVARPDYKRYEPMLQAAGFRLDGSEDRLFADGPIQILSSCLSIQNRVASDGSISL